MSTPRETMFKLDEPFAAGEQTCREWEFYTDGTVAILVVSISYGYIVTERRHVGIARWALQGSEVHVKSYSDKSNITLPWPEATRKYENYLCSVILRP